MMSKQELIFKASLTIALVLAGIGFAMSILINSNWLSLSFVSIVGMLIAVLWIS